MRADHISSLFNRQGNKNEKAGGSGLEKSFFILVPGHLLCASAMAFSIILSKNHLCNGIFSPKKRLEIYRDHS